MGEEVEVVGILQRAVAGVEAAGAVGWRVEGRHRRMGCKMGRTNRWAAYTATQILL